MTTNTIIRADVRRLIMDAAAHLAGAGDGTFTRPALVAAMARSVSPRVFAYELGSLRRDGQLWEVRPSAGARAAVYALERPKMSAADAPDFSPGFPSSGEMIGPAWRAMWAFMADGRWHDTFDVAAVGADAGGCLPGTARNLLYPAVKHGYVEADMRFDATRKRWRSWYRRILPEAGA
jgi:hypothetical protein